jgi:sporulation protein YlmC with PRC-barrel domain
VGKIDDLIVSHNNFVPFAVISSGGALGIGDKKIAVPMSELGCSEGTARLSATAEQLKNASKTATGEWTSYSNQEWTRDIDGFYGQPRRFPSTDSHFHKASKLMGKEVKNDQGERLGKVKDLIISQNNFVTFAIVSVGGAVGIGDKQIAVPMTDLNHSEDTITVAATADQLKNASKTATGDWMAYSDQEWTRGVDGYYGQPSQLRTYEREPVETSPGREPVRTPQDGIYRSDERKLPDTSSENEFERTKQGAGARDLIKHPDNANLFSKEPAEPNPKYPADTSDQALQQRVSDTLRQTYTPSNPQAISVTVDNGVVTLRGSVANDTEKKNVEATVKQMSGVRRVNNQLTTQSRY